MSADNYLVIRRKGNKWVIKELNASTDSEWKRSEHDTRDEAIDAAQRIQSEEVIEYGLQYIDPVADQSNNTKAV